MRGARMGRLATSDESRRNAMVMADEPSELASAAPWAAIHQGFVAVRTL